MRTIIRIFGIAAAVALVTNCVDHRPIRNGLSDESIYLTKSDLTNANPKVDDPTDDGWLLKVSVVAASSPNVAGDYLWPGFESDAKYVKFRFRENTLQLLDGWKLQHDDADDEDDDLATSTEAVLAEFKGQHVDTKLRESLDGERTNWLEENTEEPWQERQSFKVDFESTQYDPIQYIWWGYVDQLADCTQLTSMNLVPDSYEFDEDDQYMSFVIEVNYRLKSITGYGGCWDLVSLATNTGTGTVHYRYSFYRPGPSSFVSEEIGEKDLVNKRYGMFQIPQFFRDEDTGLLSVKMLAHKWDANRTEPVIYYFNDGFPDSYKPLFVQIADETNAALVEAGASLRFQFANKPPDIHFGDIRHSIVAWHQDIDTTKGLLGYGPSISDPRTGEIISGTVNLYNIGLDWYRFRIQAYLESFGGATREELADGEGLALDTPWEQIPCDFPDDIAHENHGYRLTAPIFDEMRRTLELPLEPGAVPEDDFIPVPDQPMDEFLDNWHRVLGEYRYAVSWWNPYVYQETGSHPLETFKERAYIEREFRDAMNEITLGNDPFNGINPASRDGIEAQLEFLDNMRLWKKNHEMFEIDKAMIWSQKNVYEFQEGDAYEATKDSARQCRPSGMWESDAQYSERIVENVVAHVAVHEFGHTISLRHNFYGSVDAKHMNPGERTASIMDYVRSEQEAAMPHGWKDYDEAAIKYIYGDAPTRDDMMNGPGNDFLYCTDNHRFFSPMCQAFDLGITPAQVVLNAIERYDWNYEIRNRRAFRKFWNTSSYSSQVYGGVFPLLRMYYMALYDLGGIADLLRTLDLVDPERTPLAPQEYNEIATDFHNNAGAAIDMVMAYYDAVLNQSAAYRNYQTEFDPFYGDVLRLGITTDKLYTTVAFMDLNEVWDYDPNLYDYVAMYDTSFTGSNYVTGMRVLDGMLGANYDTFPWFKYYALLIFADVTNTNLIGDVNLKERIAIQRFDNMMEFEEIYPNVLEQALAPDNAGQLFIHNAETYVYTYLADRNWHLVARKSRSPVSFQYMRDYNDTLNSGASGSLDTYGLKIMLAYHEYFNNFQGF